MDVNLSQPIVQYAYLQPLNILDDVTDNNTKHERELGSTDSPALTPTIEEFVSKDLHSYFFGKGKLLFDEPDTLPIIRVTVQPTRTDFVIKNKKMQKNIQPTAVQLPQKQQSIKPTNDVERKVSCRSCDRKFVTVDDMKIHAATHLKKKNKDCFVCGRRFSHGGALCLHMRSHKFARSRKS
ncbi:Krueppel-like factor 5 [Phymastichus coffea]|uniref:Krueppel-like factor 5 n=1 Tax=Phymastichus coffea TaxID=108790 RepID=UPI00273B6FA7|nr:Krueppel-like factor 5 [Phymastichus coffea]